MEQDYNAMPAEDALALALSEIKRLEHLLRQKDKENAALRRMLQDTDTTRQSGLWRD